MQHPVCADALSLRAIQLICSVEQCRLVRMRSPKGRGCIVEESGAIAQKIEYYLVIGLSYGTPKYGALDISRASFEVGLDCTCNRHVLQISSKDCRTI